VEDEQLNGGPVTAGASRALDLRPLGVVVVVVGAPLVVPVPVPLCDVEPQLRVERSAVPEFVATVPSDHVPCVVSDTVPVVVAGSVWVKVVLWNGADPVPPLPLPDAAMVNVDGVTVDVPPVAAVTVPVSLRFVPLATVHVMVYPAPGVLAHDAAAVTTLASATTAAALKVTNPATATREARPT